MKQHNTLEKNRKTIRLKNYDYSQPGAYFITICTHNRECLFGKIENGKMIENDAGKIARECWEEIPLHFPNTIIDEFVIMPNHIHGIIIITEKLNPNGENNVGVQYFEPLQNIESQRINKFQKIIPGSIGSIVRGFKIGVTKWFRENTNVYNVWQRNYYEHIIRNDESLNKIRQYIRDNPLQWELDDENPETRLFKTKRHYEQYYQYKF